MRLMTKPKIFDVFIVDAESESFYLPEKTTVGLTQKSCGIEPEFENGRATATIKISSRVKRMRTDTLGELQGFSARHLPRVRRGGACSGEGADDDSVFGGA